VLCCHKRSDPCGSLKAVFYYNDCHHLIKKLKVLLYKSIFTYIIDIMNNINLRKHQQDAIQHIGKALQTNDKCLKEVFKIYI
jgi:hypothetical protein